MKHYDRDLLVLYKAENYNEDLLEQEVASLHRILRQVECSDVFCSSHELVTRNRISSRAGSILKAVKHLRLRPFHFLINKN